MIDLQGASDMDVLLAWQQGNASAFAELYARYEAPLYRYFRRQLNNPPADDVFQELWLRLIGSANSTTSNATASQCAPLVQAQWRAASLLTFASRRGKS